MTYDWRIGFIILTLKIINWKSHATHSIPTVMYPIPHSTLSSTTKVHMHYCVSMKCGVVSQDWYVAGATTTWSMRLVRYLMMKNALFLAFFFVSQLLMQG